MSEESQLFALQKACEVKEQEISVRKREVTRVRLERLEVVEQVESRLEKLTEKLIGLTNEERLKAAQSARGEHFRSIVGYVERVRQEHDQVEKLLEDKRKDLQMAIEREKIVDEEMLAARMESRRVEKLLEERNLRSLVHSSALEEVSVDELSSSIIKRPTE